MSDAVYDSAILTWAPGDEIFSTFLLDRIEWTTMQGTSMACPYVR